MEAIKQIHKNLKKINLNTIVKEIIEEPEIKQLIIDLNFKYQLNELGIDIKGNVVGYYSWATEYAFGGAEKGKFFNQPYNFDDTGAFKNSFDVKSYPTYFEISAASEKMEDTEQIGDAEILGLTDKSMEKLIDAINPKIIERIKDKILI